MKLGAQGALERTSCGTLDREQCSTKHVLRLFDVDKSRALIHFSRRNRLSFYWIYMYFAYSTVASPSPDCVVAKEKSQCACMNSPLPDPPGNHWERLKPHGLNVPFTHRRRTTPATQVAGLAGSERWVVPNTRMEFVSRQEHAHAVASLKVTRDQVKFRLLYGYTIFSRGF